MPETPKPEELETSIEDGDRDTGLAEGPDHVASRRGWTRMVLHPDHAGAKGDARYSPILAFDTEEARDAHAALVDEVASLRESVADAEEDAAKWCAQLNEQFYDKRYQEMKAERDAARQESGRLREERDMYRGGFEKASDALDAQIRNDAVVEMERDGLRKVIDGLMPFVILECTDQRGWARCRACGFRWSIESHPEGVHSETCATLPAVLLTEASTAQTGDSEP